MTIDRERAKLLGEFLKSRREKMSPTEAGLPDGYGRRRTPGLRREEVAQLAHVSTTWYTWLEQGRASAPSRQVLDSIARALRLSEDEHRHLLHLAGEDLPAPRKAPAVEQMAGELQRIVDQIAYPAFVANDRTEVLAWNGAAAKVICDFAAIAPEDRSMLWLTFRHEPLRRSIADWEAYARYTAAVVRGRYEKHLEDAAFRRLIDRVLGASVEFRGLWSTRDIAEKTLTRLRIDHPEAGPLAFHVHSFSQLNGNDQAHCCIYSPADEETAARLRRIGIG
jgi:hypothetical protein